MDINLPQDLVGLGIAMAVLHLTRHLQLLTLFTIPFPVIPGAGKLTAQATSGIRQQPTAVAQIMRATGLSTLVMPHGATTTSQLGDGPNGNGMETTGMQCFAMAGHLIVDAGGETTCIQPVHTPVPASKEVK